MNTYLIISLLTCLLFVFFICVIKCFITFFTVNSKNINGNNAKSNKNKTLLPISLKTYSFFKIIFVVILFSIILLVLINKVPKSNRFYYDKKQNSYSSNSDVVFYDENDNEYILEQDTKKLINENSETNDMWLIDQNGFVIDTSNLGVLTTEYDGINYNKSDKTLLFNAYCIYWKSDGTLMYHSGYTDIPVREMKYEDYVY